MDCSVFSAGTTDEQAIFDDLKSTNAMLLTGLSDRIFFVLNKVDAAKFCAGATIEESRRNVAERITKAMDMPEFTLTPDQASCGMTELQLTLLLLILLLLLIWLSSKLSVVGC